MFNYLGDKPLRFLPTKFFYDQLDNGRNSCQSDTFYNLAKAELDKTDGLQDVSDKILKALCYVYEKSLINNFESDICNFLYYWLGDILLDKMSNKVVFLDVIRDLFNILKNRKGKICTAPIYHINVENFKNIKFFFDYSEDYNTYIEHFNTHNPPCNEKYQKYLQTYVETYNTFQSKCQNEPRSYAYCDVFNEYFNKKDPGKLSKWTCNLQYNEPEQIEKSDDTETTEEQPPVTHGIVGQSLTLNRGFQGDRKQGAERLRSSDFPQHLDTFLIPSALDPPDNSSPSTITKSVASAASVAGLLVPPFLAYNYTPAGTWINKLLGRNQMNRSPLTEAQLIENFHQPEYFNSERSRYNISYRPG
ncbi:PIR protein [Plasmodium vivax]|nr:PIR protein [Plasmodium vivax]